mgnify:FL=1
MKESEAKLKTCPFIQHMALAVGVDNHLMNPYSDINIYCKTVGCMAWERNENDNQSEDKDGFCVRLKK